CGRVALQPDTVFDVFAVRPGVIGRAAYGGVQQNGASVGDRLIDCPLQQWPWLVTGKVSIEPCHRVFVAGAVEQDGAFPVGYGCAHALSSCCVWAASQTSHTPASVLRKSMSCLIKASGGMDASASVGASCPGKSGAAPAPLPALPPEFSFTSAPTTDTPPASSLIKLPPACTVSSEPASITSFCPALRWISSPASMHLTVPSFVCWLSATVRCSSALSSTRRLPWVMRCSSALNSLRLLCSTVLWRRWPMCKRWSWLTCCT